MDENIIAGLIGVSVFLVCFVIAVLITVKSKL
nr:MAG TPA: Membrane-associated protein [Caudoviricetes sp.]